MEDPLAPGDLLHAHDEQRGGQHHECLPQAAVGVICPECMAQQQAAETPAQKKAQRRWVRSAPAAVVAGGRPTATLTIIAITGLAYVIGLIPGVGGIVGNALAFYPPYLVPQFGPIEPWRVLTTALVHSGFFHVGLNMLALWFVGAAIEPRLGRDLLLAAPVAEAAVGDVGLEVLAPLALGVRVGVRVS